MQNSSFEVKFFTDKKEKTMFYNVQKAKDLIELDDKKFERKTLLEDGDSSICVVALKKDEVIDNHTSVKDAAVCVIDGEIEIHFAAEKFEIKKGEFIMFEKEKEHKVLAKKDSKFLLIKI